MTRIPKSVDEHRDRPRVCCRCSLTGGYHESSLLAIAGHLRAQVHCYGWMSSAEDIIRDRILVEVMFETAAMRFKPIQVTGIAVMIGAVVILADPILQGLAMSLLFDLDSSTSLTVLVMPAIYVLLRR